MPAINHFGLDIGTHSIKLVQLSGSQATPTFITAGQFPTPPQALLSETDTDLQASATTIKTLTKEANT